MQLLFLCHQAKEKNLAWKKHRYKINKSSVEAYIQYKSHVKYSPDLNYNRLVSKRVDSYWHNHYDALERGLVKADKEIETTQKNG